MGAAQAEALKDVHGFLRPCVKYAKQRLKLDFVYIVCVFLSCLPASEHFRSDVGKTKEGSIPPLVYSIADHSDKQVRPLSFTLFSYQFILNTPYTLKLK